MAKIIAICGKICCGKTHYANVLKEKENAVILSCDELTKALFDNDLGEKHDEMTWRIRMYLQKKAAEMVKAGCSVILDWGFWSSASRKELAKFCRTQNIPCQWHYIEVDDRTWNRNIQERNAKIARGEGGSDYHLDQGLLGKLLSIWEAPKKDEIDVWYTLKRE